MEAIKARKLDGLHFRKQHPPGRYVLDFYCDAAKLCIEVDGHAHDTGRHPMHDQQRDEWLAAQGIKTLRVSAALMLNDVDDAVATIRQALET